MVWDKSTVEGIAEGPIFSSKAGQYVVVESKVDSIPPVCLPNPFNKGGMVGSLDRHAVYTCPYSLCWQPSSGLTRVQMPFMADHNQGDGRKVESSSNHLQCSERRKDFDKDGICYHRRSFLKRRMPEISEYLTLSRRQGSVAYPQVYFRIS